jgi:hypothetical protein
MELSRMKADEVPAAAGDDEFTRLQTVEHFDRLTCGAAELNRAFHEAPRVAPGRNVDNTAIAHRLHMPRAAPGGPAGLSSIRS